MLLLQRLVDGIQSGVLYGALGMAVVLVYRSTGVLNFAAGEMAMLCTFVIWLFAADGLGLPIVVAILAGAMFGFAFGAGLERIVMRPFAQADHLRQAMVTTGLLLAINAAAGYLFSLDAHRLDSPFPAGGLDLGGVVVSYRRAGAMLLLVGIAIALRLVFTRTKLGLAMTGAAMNPASARMLGINVPRMLMLGWGMAAMLGAIVGAMVAPELFLSTTMMQALLLYGFAAAVLGGLDSYEGALVGGVAIGIIQSLASGYVGFIGTQLQLATAFAAILAVLLIRPEGLFGRKQVERV
ncbi:branched-chain amino acid ABC transporter permease [Jiangella alba]|uniref:Amino acid/amide ABC transporter membrane protein 1, HAAT family n=1 Tax=Jiangella alba TaxID=561176 RepID=A0A1H5K1E2_9ACTN|nr:branched-chain amino acid ABC transporter permease [Jiangella alba]SEE58297.1 amino acid/amide ABC transporter membrane protein 1, HAAT family [Jiangella alba]